jgi:protein-S-isoprenylcysteine O-methyltransferase Ste14
MLADSDRWVQAIWILVGVVWIATSFRLKPTVAYRADDTRSVQITLLVMAGFCLFSTWPRILIPDVRLEFDPRTAAPMAAFLGTALATAGKICGVLIALGGASFAIAARLDLGTNWSGVAVLKQEHDLITSGTYSLVRHPIYTGLSFAALGTAMAGEHLAGFLGVALLVTAFELKRRAEERLLLSSLIGDKYAAYRQSVRTAFIPFIL